jgi:hypothetical protein
MNAKSKWLLLFVLVVDCVMGVNNSGYCSCISYYIYVNII